MLVRIVVRFTADLVLTGTQPRIINLPEAFSNNFYVHFSSSKLDQGVQHIYVLYIKTKLPNRDMASPNGTTGFIEC